MLRNRDLAGALAYKWAVPAGTYTTTAEQDEVDLAGVEGPIVGVALSVEAASAGASPTFDLSFEESEDGDSWDAIDGDALVSPATGEAATFTRVTDAADSAQVLGLRAELLKRYVRAVVTIGGAAGPSFVAACALVCNKKYV